MNISVVIIGHVDHGKSTLIGRLLYDSDSITEGRVEEIQKLAEEYRKRFEFAYFIDAFDDELKEERTIDTTGVMFKGRNLYTVTDVPGHKEFIKNMLTGASRADIAVLVVAADEGIQEQTRRHAFLIRMLGLKKLFVVVNKMDLVDYRKEFFDDVKEKVSALLSSLGYQDVLFVPGSAMEGDNVCRRSGKMPWYQGPALIEALDSVELSERQQRPLRFVVQDNYLFDGQKVTVGRVESGIMREGDDMVFQPSGARGTVERIVVFGGNCEVAKEGDSVGIITNCQPERGDVGGLTGDVPEATTTFVGEAVLLADRLSKGEKLELKCGTRKVRCRIEELREKIDSETGEVLMKSPDYISEHEAATVVFKTEPLVVERFARIPELGRFVLVRERKNIGAGIVLEVSP